MFARAPRGPLSLEVGAEAGFPSAWKRGDGSGFRGGVALATLAACKQLGAGVFSLCGVGKVGWFHAAGLGVDDPVSPAAWFGQAGAARVAATTGVIPRPSATIHADFLGTVNRLTFVLNGTEAWTMPSAAILAGLDLAFAFP